MQKLLYNMCNIHSSYKLLLHDVSSAQKIMLYEQRNTILSQHEHQ